MPRSQACSTYSCVFIFISVQVLRNSLKKRSETHLTVGQEIVVFQALRTTGLNLKYDSKFLNVQLLETISQLLNRDKGK